MDINIGGTTPHVNIQGAGGGPGTATGPGGPGGPGSGTGPGRGHEMFKKLAQALKSGDPQQVSNLLKAHPKFAQKLAQKLGENGGQLPRLEARMPGASKAVAAALQGGQ